MSYCAAEQENLALLDAFRLIAKEYTMMDDEEVLAYMEICRDLVSKKRFGPFYAKAVAYYAAHLMKLGEMVEDSGANGGALVAGNIVSETEGDLSRSYGAVQDGPSKSEADAMLNKTSYGKMFLALRAACIVPVCTRMGGGGYGCRR